MKFLVGLVLVIFSPRGGEAQTSPCLFGTLPVQVGCHFDPLEATMQAVLDRVPYCGGRSAVTELSLMLRVAPSAVPDTVNAMCRQAIQDEKDAQSLSFLEIVDHSNVFVKEFFDGGTDWNEGRQTTDIDGNAIYRLQQDLGPIIAPVFANEAQSGFIDFPDDISNFEGCALNGVMCCWVQDRQAGDDNGTCETPYDSNCADADPALNTDICYVDMKRAPESARVPNGYALYPGFGQANGEGGTHCHGFAWGDNEFDPSVLFQGNTLFFVSMYDHLLQRGYVRNVPGAPMCSCLEQAPVVARSDCTQANAVLPSEWTYANGSLSLAIVDIQIRFTACQGVPANNNLLDHYNKLIQDGRLTSVSLSDVQEHLVGNTGCPAAIQSFLQEEFGRI